MFQAIFHKVLKVLLYLLSALQSLLWPSHIIVLRRASTGRPIRPALVLQRLSEFDRFSLSADLNLGYLEDVTLGGSEEVIASLENHRYWGFLGSSSQHFQM